MCWIISFIESLSPPGVSMVIKTREAWCWAASARPSSMYVARIGSTSPSSFNSWTEGPLVFSLALDDGSNSIPAATASTPKTDENEASHIRPGGSFLPNRSAALTAHPRLAFLRAPWTSASDPATVLPLRSRRQPSRLFGLRPRKVGFFLLQINFRQDGAHLRRVSRGQRFLQFLHGVIHLALMALDFTQTPMRSGIRGLGRKRGAKILLGGGHVPSGEFLPSFANARGRSVGRSSHRNSARRSV